MSDSRQEKKYTLLSDKRIRNFMGKSHVDLAKPTELILDFLSEILYCDVYLLYE